jgi:hypothetical protein
MSTRIKDGGTQADDLIRRQSGLGVATFGAYISRLSSIARETDAHIVVFRVRLQGSSNQDEEATQHNADY